MGKNSILACALFALTPAFSQHAPGLPAWLATYPSASPDVRSTSSLVESTYTTSAQPEDIVAHYRKLFEAASLPFLPNFDGMERPSAPPLPNATFLSRFAPVRTALS